MARPQLVCPLCLAPSCLPGCRHTRLAPYTPAAHAPREGWRISLKYLREPRPQRDKLLYHPDHRNNTARPGVKQCELCRSKSHIGTEGYVSQYWESPDEETMAVREAYIDEHNELRYQMRPLWFCSYYCLYVYKDSAFVPRE